MRFQELGSSGRQVSRICLGTWQLGGSWGADYEDGIAAVGVAFELGVNFFDSAYAYGQGAAERALARGLGDLAKRNREELVISTKGGIEMRPAAAEGGSDVAYRNSDPTFLRSCLERSLDNLGLDYVDLYFVHWPDPTIPFAETAGLIGEFVAEGLVRYCGLSNFSVPQMREFAAAGQVDVAQLPYNLLDRRSEDEAIPFCADRGVGVMGWSGLAHGVLSGTLRRGQAFPAGDWRGAHPAFAGERFEAVMDGVEQLTEIAAGLGCSLPQLALAWILANEAAIVPIVGAQVPQHIVDSAAAVEVELGPEETRRISEVAARIPSFSLEAEDQIRVRGADRSRLRPAS